MRARGGALLAALVFSIAARVAAAQESGSGVYDDEDDAALKTRLLAAYGPRSTRPGLAARKLGLLSTLASCAASQVPPDVVEAQFYVDKWHPLETKLQTFGLDGYLRAWWQDPRLRYNGTAAGGCRDKLVFGASERDAIWKPEFYWEGIEVPLLPKGGGRGESLEADPDGRVWWSRQVSIVSSCPVSSSRSS